MANPLVRAGHKLLLLMVLGANSQAIAGIRPSFSLEDSSWHATDIVVATAGEKIDGNVKVLEAWKGGLKAGDRLSVPELTAFAPETARTVSTWPGDKGQRPPVHITGSRLVLFLKKAAGNPEKWAPANLHNDMKVSVVWVEQGNIYSFVQFRNPGPSLLTTLGGSEEALKGQVGTITRTQTALAEASSVKDLAQRAQALRPFLGSKLYFARRSAFRELPKCREAALPVLRAMLNDEAMAPQHGDIVEALGEAGGTTVGAELTRLVETETEFWKQTAPKLRAGWWNGTGLQWSEVEALRNRYSRVLSALYALKRMEFRGANVP